MAHKCGVNLIDFFFLLLCLRVVYSAIARGIVSEAFKMAGLLTGAFFAFHYHSFVRDTFTNISFLNQQYVDFLSFIAIFVSVTTLFGIARLIVTLLFKRKDISSRERWAMLFVGTARAIFLTSIMLFALYLSPLNNENIVNCLSFRLFKNVAPRTYLMMSHLYRHPGVSEITTNKEVEEYHETATTLSGSD